MGRKPISKKTRFEVFKRDNFSTEIAREKYILSQHMSLNYAFEKIGGICYNRANNIKGVKTWE